MNIKKAKSIFKLVILSLPLWYGVISASAETEREVDNGLPVPPVSAAEPSVAFPTPEAASLSSVSVRAASGAAIMFTTQNGETVNGVHPQELDVPYLVLHRNGALTDPNERTLFVEVTGIEIPPSGVTVRLELTSQHGNPDPGAGLGAPITVWRVSRSIANTLGFTQTGVSVTFRHTFTETVMSGTQTIATPTDYFRYDVVIVQNGQRNGNPSQVFAQDYAFLLENQWIVPLPEVREASPGAAPDELIVYYSDMFPFRKDPDDSASWVARQDVPDYIGSELVPAMVEAFRVQTDEWGFPWYQAWTSYRPGRDGKRLSVALSDGQTWFHGPAPLRGHSGISINVNAGSNANYDTLTDGLMSNFHHELFHSLQRNINQASGGDGFVDGADDAWQFFSEGLAVLASSVGQPDVQFNQTSEARAYMDNANNFVGGGGRLGGLTSNRSYAKMSPYQAAVYWRFLYEQCGGTRARSGAEDSAAGMRVIRRTLMELYAREGVDIGSSTDLVQFIPGIMNHVLSSPEASACPFHTYQDSLIHFSRALFALRLDGGRSLEPGDAAESGFFDPKGLYRDPAVGTITYAGTPITYGEANQPYPAGIRNSYGLDFVIVELQGDVDGQSLSVELHGAPGVDAAFIVQIWKLMDPGDGSKPHPISIQSAAPEVLTAAGSDGRISYVIPTIDTGEFNRLGLIITRVDPDESVDPAGTYALLLHPDTEHHAE